MSSYIKVDFSQGMALRKRCSRFWNYPIESPNNFSFHIGSPGSLPSLGSRNEYWGATKPCLLGIWIQIIQARSIRLIFSLFRRDRFWKKSFSTVSHTWGRDEVFILLFGEGAPGDLNFLKKRVFRDAKNLVVVETVKEK